MSIGRGGARKQNVIGRRGRQKSQFFFTFGSEFSEAKCHWADEADREGDDQGRDDATQAVTRFRLRCDSNSEYDLYSFIESNQLRADR